MNSRESLQQQLDETLDIISKELVDGEVQDDLEIQTESLNSNLQIDEDMALSECHSFDRDTNTADEPPMKRQRVRIDFVESVVRGAAAHDILAHTIYEYTRYVALPFKYSIDTSNHNDYRCRLWDQFVAFSVKVGYVSGVDALNEELAEGNATPANYLSRVATWIMSRYLILQASGWEHLLIGILH
jgi:hypothetical protein